MVHFLLPVLCLINQLGRDVRVQGSPTVPTLLALKHCERQKSGLRVRFRPSLFQHVGLHSSLAGKIQKLTDKDFLKPLLHKIHVNPPAEVSTSLKVYQGHTLEKTYLGEDFFWAINPTEGDYILLRFDRPVSIDRFLFRSGNQEHPGDRIENTTVEILPFSDNGLQTKVKYKKTDDNFYRIGQFQKGVAEGVVDPSFNPVLALRLSVLKNSAVWAIVSEIHIKKIAG
ncbi:alpha-1,3-mannosyl-glycoprotein 4-beta-N-acetylglucosaminyltransferase A [Hypomesus transpacificus]|uniref:alpha-1,3-mannosyl-glycoprotein 4-beta-N-acetylglucosaminyltransferase A n=1 Tax=Hypomesus transpacificus TaxID=137520 RepID=UPI001F0824B8|nr:alpha-1,3-mannosyl-glycoprotein 4-beta-N-acetylglucosaminyltransferase A [Hypomesus transpacificus]